MGKSKSFFRQEKKGHEKGIMRGTYTNNARLVGVKLFARTHTRHSDPKNNAQKPRRVVDERPPYKTYSICTYSSSRSTTYGQTCTFLDLSSQVCRFLRESYGDRGETHPETSTLSCVRQQHTRPPNNPNKRNKTGRASCVCDATYVSLTLVCYLTGNVKYICISLPFYLDLPIGSIIPL
jgi:hypothetical protein